MRSLASDVRDALRSLTRHPTSTAAIVVTLALGIGATTAAYALFNLMLFRPVPGVVQPDDLVTIHFQPATQRNTLAYGPSEALPLLRQVPGLASLGGGRMRALSFKARANSDPAIEDIELVSSGYFETLGTKARIGRLFADDETTMPGHDVALISEPLWRNVFVGDERILGHQIFVNSLPFTVVGVVDDYEGWGRTRIGIVDVWLPGSAESAITGRAPERTISTLVGRRRAGIDVSIIEQQVQQSYAGMAATLSGRDAQFVPTVYPGLHAFQGDSYRTRMTALMPFVFGGTGLLLILACANVANLLLAQTARRERELAVRQAMGAGSWALLRRALIETTMLAALSAAAGLALAQLITAAVRGNQLFSWTPELQHVPIDWRVVAFAIAVAAITVFVCGLVPAVSASRVDLRHLTQSAATRTPGRRRFRIGIACVQIAVSLALMAAGGVLLRSLQHLRSLDLGMDPEQVMTFRLDPARLGYSTPRRETLVRQIVDRLQREPGVQAAAFVSGDPVSGNVLTSVRSADSYDGPLASPAGRAVSPRYFELLRIPVLAGRTLTDDEFQRAAVQPTGVAVINETLKRELFGELPAASAVGRRLAIAARPSERFIEVVGVVGDTRSGPDLRAAPRGLLYEPGPPAINVVSFHVRSGLPPADILGSIRRVVREADPLLPITEAGRLRDAIGQLNTDDRTLAYLVSLLAVVATLLGLGGVSAVCSYAVAERTREFGIRIAIGASAASVAREVLKDVGAMCAIGVPLGLGIFAMSRNILNARLHGVSALDIPTLAVVCTSLLLAAVVAAWPPAARAIRVDPVASLRAD